MPAPMRLTGEWDKTHILDGRLAHVILLELFTHFGVGTQIISDEGAE